MSKISELSDGGSLVSSDYLIAVRSGGNVKVRMDQINVDQVDLGDNEFIRLGNSQDLTMVHTSTQSIINQAGIGDLLIQKAGATKLTINATGIDVTGSVTADGLTVDGDATISDTTPSLLLMESDTTDVNTRLLNNGGDFFLATINDAKSAVTNRLSVDHATGSISFFEDTGTTAKLFWDASAESLGIGTSSPSSVLELSKATYPLLTITQSTTGQSWQLGNDGSNLYVYNATGSSRVLDIDASGNVGIGTSSPDAKVHSYQSAANYAAHFESANANSYGIWVEEGASANNGYPLLSVTDNGGSTQYFRVDSGTGNVGIGISPSAKFDVLLGSTSRLLLRERSSRAYIDSVTETNNAFDSLGINGSEILFETDGTERMRIDASGNLLVSDTTANPSGDNVDSGIALHNAGLVRASTNNAAAPLDLNIKGRNGDIAVFQKDGSTVGSIGTYSGGLDVAGSTRGLRITDGSVFPVANAGSVSDNYVNLGYSGGRFKDLFLSGGVVFGTTGGSVSSKTLDDYEEGTWTPVLTRVGATADATVTFGAVSRYVKVGGLVHLTFYASVIDWSTVSGGTTVVVTGLPFNASSWTTGTIGYGNSTTVSDTTWVASTNIGYFLNNNQNGFYTTGTAPDLTRGMFSISYYEV